MMLRVSIPVPLKATLTGFLSSTVLSFLFRGPLTKGLWSMVPLSQIGLMIHHPYVVSGIGCRAVLLTQREENHNGNS